MHKSFNYMHLLVQLLHCLIFSQKNIYLEVKWWACGHFIVYVRQPEWALSTDCLYIRSPLFPLMAESEVGADLTGEFTQLLLIMFKLPKAKPHRKCSSFLQGRSGMNCPRFSYTTEYYEAIVTSMLGVDGFICWNPDPHCDGIRGGAFGRWLGHEGDTLKSEISAFIKRIQRFLLPLPSFEGRARGWLLWTRKWFFSRHWVTIWLDHQTS